MLPAADEPRIATRDDDGALDGVGRAVVAGGAATGAPETLQPDGANRKRLRLRSTAAFVAVAVVAGILLWLRLPAGVRDTMWAEDGAYFLEGASRFGLGRLFVPYAGYLQFVPTVIAAIVVHLPVSLWAVGMTAGACVASGLCAAVVFACSGAVIRPLVPRLLVAGVTVLLPLGPRDVFGNPTNIHTVLIWTLFWILMAQPRGRRVGIALSVVGLVCALSEIQTAFLLPLVVWRLVRGRGSDRWLAVGPAVGIAAQVVATVIAPRGANHNPHVSAQSIVIGYLLNGIVPLASPISSIGRVASSGGLVIAGLVVAAVIVAAAALWHRLETRSRIALVGALTLGPLVYAASVYVNPAPYYDYAHLSPSALDHAWITRYGVAPGMFFLAAVVIVASTWQPRSLPPVASLAVLTIVTICLTAFFVPTWTRRSDGPLWSAQVAAAAERCETPGVKSVPVRQTLGWLVPVDCSRLTPTKGWDRH